MNKPASNGNQSSTDAGENKVQSKIAKTKMKEAISRNKNIVTKDSPNNTTSDSAAIEKLEPKDNLKRNQTKSSNDKSQLNRLPKDSSTLEKKRPAKENSAADTNTSLDTEEAKSNLNNVAR